MEWARFWRKATTSRRRLRRCLRPNGAGKDFAEPLAKLETALKLLRAGGVDEYGPMKYALSLQMGTRQFYQRPPNSDVTEEQKGKIKEALDEIKKMG